MKVTSCLHRYSTTNAFIQSFLPDKTSIYLDLPEGREGMITTENVPTLTIAKYAYGEACVKSLVMAHLFELKKAFAVNATEEQIEIIADDIVYNYGYLKVTELMLFFKLMRGGAFRSGENDRGKMYGGLSGEVIADCLYQFKTNYRDTILRKHEDELNKQKREEDAMRQATQEEKFQIFLVKCLQDFSFIELIKSQQWLMEKEIQSIEQTIAELKALRQFYKVGKEYVEKVNAGCDPKTTMKRLENGVNYIQNKIYNESHDR